MQLREHDSIVYSWISGLLQVAKGHREQPGCTGFPPMAALSSCIRNRRLSTNFSAPKGGWCGFQGSIWQWQD